MIDTLGQSDVRGIPFETSALEPGDWTLLFTGQESQHQAVIYFRILPPDAT
ncbi:MAG: hypothetical protein HC837_09025 [Chloroflexaceae bacterium]|nr:hypothetical protein [Chloroflexaceae bacterium]